MAADQPPTNTPAMTPAPAAGPPKGEFDNSCTMGLASGQVVKTDCSINWTAPDGKVYCFSREASKETFLKNPSENIQKAKEFFLAKDLAKNNATARPPPPARTKDGAFVFRDPKLNADLNLVFEQIKIVQSRRSRRSFVRLNLSATVVSCATQPTNSHEKRQTSPYGASLGGRDTWTG
jgi:YHS domain-containing protein